MVWSCMRRYESGCENNCKNNEKDKNVERQNRKRNKNSFEGGGGQSPIEM